MNKGIIIVLIIIVAAGLFGLYALQQGPALFLGSPPSDRIAFISSHDGHTDLWTMRPDGSDLIRVTKDAADERSPAWSPDGREIAAVSNRQDNVYQIYVSAWNGQYTRPATNSTGAKDYPQWSRDSSEITFTANGKISVVDPRSGNEEQKLPPEGQGDVSGMMGTSHPMLFGAWSKDHNHLLFIQDADVGKAALEIDTPNGQVPTDTDFKPQTISIGHGVDAAWSLIGTRIAAAFIDRNGENGISVVDVSSMNGADIFLTKGDGNGAADPVWSPDGSRIAFEMWAVKDGIATKCLGVYTIPADGGKPTKVISGDARQPSWSSDGKQIVYTLPSKDGNRDIWKVNADGTSAVNLTKGNGDNSYPLWSPARRSKS